MFTEVAQGIAKIGDTASETAKHMRLLGEAHLELAEEEFTFHSKRFFRGVALLGLAISLSLVALVMFSLGSITLIIAMWDGEHTSMAYFTIGIVWAVLALVLGQIGYHRLCDASPVPRATLESLKESLRCLGKN